MWKSENLTREQKIKALQAIKEGRLNPQELQAAKYYQFFQKDYNDFDIYTKDGQDYTEQQYQEFSDSLDEINRQRRSCGLPEHFLLRVTYGDKKIPGALTLRL